MKLHHIGYAVGDIETSERGFAALGFKRDGAPTEDERRNVRILFMSSLDGTIIELVEPLNENAPVVGSLATQRGVAHPYHLCYTVADIEKCVADLKREGFVPISDIAPAPAIGSHDVCFLLSKNVGLIELVEE